MSAASAGRAARTSTPERVPVASVYRRGLSPDAGGVRVAVQKLATCLAPLRNRFSAGFSFVQGWGTGAPEGLGQFRTWWCS